MTGGDAEWFVEFASMSWAQIEMTMFERCVQGLRQGQFDVIITERVKATSMLAATPGACDELSLSSDLQFGTGDSLAFVLHRTSSSLRMRLDEVIYFIHTQPDMGQALQDELFQLNSFCPKDGAKVNAQVGLDSQAGVFLIVIILFVVAVALEGGLAVKHRRQSANATDVTVAGDEGDRERTDRELILSMLRLLEQQKSQPSTQSQPAQSEMVRTARAGAESPDAGLTRRRPGESPGADRPEEKELKI